MQEPNATMPLDAATHAHLAACVERPRAVVRIPERFRPAYAARQRDLARRLVRIGGPCAIVLALTILSARLVFFGTHGTPADQQLYEEISIVNMATILLTSIALRSESVFRFYPYVMMLAAGVVLASTHAGSILLEDPRIALTATYAGMFGATIVTIGFRNGIRYSAATCALGLAGGTGFAVYRGAHPDWVLVSYGYVGACAVGLVIEAILERQEVLHFFRSLLLAHESEERRRLNEELEKMSHTDSLSGLANRRSFDDALDDEWERMKRERQPLSLLFVDVDHFKRYNDAYGHREGDACLRAVGRSLAACSTRPSDLAARYGGEEFVLLLPNTDARTAQNIAERVLEAVDALNIPHVDSPTAEHVTVSVGVASAPVGAGREARHLVETADACLYRAKNEGRHRICLSELRGDSIRPRPTRTSAIALK